ncbi:hypothetical protein QQ045_016244 [Rhodiola kirilowii]
MGFAVSDELLGTIVPIVVYWIYSGLYVMMGSLDEYRLHSRKDEGDKNLVTKSAVVKGVLLQQIIQAAVAIMLFSLNLLRIYWVCDLRKSTVCYLLIMKLKFRKSLLRGLMYLYGT